MDMSGDLEVFLAAPPGLEPILCLEAEEQGFAHVASVPGGVTFTGSWPEVWRANLALRGATRVLVRVGQMPAPHLAQLDKRARRLPWNAFLRPDVPVRIEATCKGSRIYHSGAAAQRIAGAIGAVVKAPVRQDASVRVFVRIENDLCTVSVDTSGELLHKRGYKEAVGKAPLRETLAALFLRACDFKGGEPVFDPMCGSGTLVIEAAEAALGLAPGRGRSFAFEQLASFDGQAWQTVREQTLSGLDEAGAAVFCHGSDRDAGAVAMARTNAQRAGVEAVTAFHQCTISDAKPPDDGRPGLVIVNPPYGARLGDRDALRDLYARLGSVLRERFKGWRVGLITSDRALAAASGLPFRPPGPFVPHGSLRIRLFQTGPLD